MFSIQRKYSILLIIITILIFSFVTTFVQLFFNIINLELVGIQLPTWLLIQQISGALTLNILGNVSIIFLIFGSYKLKNLFIKYKLVPYVSFSIIALNFLYFSIDLIRLILVLIMREPIPFDFIFDMVFRVYIYGFIFVVFPISFIIFGVSNRNRYGNYIVSAGIMGVMGFITSTFSIIFNDPTQFVFNNWSFLIFFAIDQLVWCLLLILSASFLLFFSLRIKNKFFLIYTLLNFAKQFYSFYWRLTNWQMEAQYVIFILVYIFSVSVGILFAIKFFELGKRFRRGLRVFISHSVTDFKRYRVEEIANYLESQKGIGSVLYCETDLIGNIDEWMRKIVPRSNLLLFISSEDSMVSQDCKTELALAESNNLQVIPVLGFGLVWDDLKKLNLNREYGTSFDPMEFENFCKELYKVIIKYKEDIEVEISSSEEKEKQES